MVHSGPVYSKSMRYAFLPLLLSSLSPSSSITSLVLCVSLVRSEDVYPVITPGEVIEAFIPAETHPFMGIFDSISSDVDLVLDKTALNSQTAHNSTVTKHAWDDRGFSGKDDWSKRGISSTDSWSSLWNSLSGGFITDAATVEGKNAASPLFPLDHGTLITLLLSSLGIMVAACGGIGGGGFLVPMYIMLMGFSDQAAVALSNITIFGGAIANAGFNLGKRTEAGLPVIDWDIILLMEPSTLLGALIGGFLNKVMPSFVLMVLLTVVLAYMGLNTTHKAVKNYKEESQRSVIQDSTLSVIEPSIHNQNLLVGSHQNLTAPLNEQSPSTTASTFSSVAPSPHAGALDRSMPSRPMSSHNSVASSNACSANNLSSSSSQKQKLVAFLPVYLGCLLLTILRGGGGFHTVECGGFGYWFLALANIPFVFAFLVYYRKRILEQQRSGFRSNIKWDDRNTIVYPLISSVAGLFAGLFGVGGGIVKGPLMLALGVEPKVSSATAATMIFFTASTTCVCFLFFGLANYEYGLLMFCVGFVCTAFGQAMVAKFCRGKQWPIIMSIGGAILLASAASGGEAVEMGIDHPRALFKFRNLCPHEPRSWILL